jgi:hypothetical protein
MFTFVKSAAGEFGRVDQYEYVDNNDVKVMLALKLLNRDLLCNDNDVRNFINEMRTLRRVRAHLALSPPPVVLSRYDMLYRDFLFI